jgi:hypothetical protein
MQKPMTRRSALPFVFAAVSIPSVAAVAPPGVAAVTDGPPVVEGYGRCYTCGCAGFTGNGNICNNCGHNYAAHW